MFPLAETSWVTVVPETSEHGQVNQAVVNSNRATLMHLVNAEDHGWQFSLYEGRDRKSDYSCMWEDDVQVTDDDLDLGLVRRLVIGSAQRKSDTVDEEIHRILYPESIDALFEEFEGSPAYAFAQLIGLRDYEWISWHYMTVDDAIRSHTLGIVEV